MRPLALALLLVGCSRSVPPDPHALFVTVCAPCHGVDGHAQTPQGRLVGAKDLASAEARKMTDDDIRRQIKNGKNKMPAFGTALKGPEIEMLVGEVRKIQGR